MTKLGQNATYIQLSFALLASWVHKFVIDIDHTLDLEHFQMRSHYFLYVIIGTSRMLMGQSSFLYSAHFVTHTQLVYSYIFVVTINCYSVSVSFGS